jgi:hypothetical protein
MPRPAALKTIIVATLVCGTLDILLATALTLLRGRAPADMLRFVASGPFPSASECGTAGAILGLAVHFTLMAIMVAVFVLVASRRPTLLGRPVVAGVAYGIVTYGVMNLIVVPLRFPAAFPPSPISLATQLFAHIALVGLPAAFIARRFMAAKD